MRQIVLDTETTGIGPELGHRIIEIGCVELDGRQFAGREFHQYINPERDSDPDALRVHQLSTAFLSSKPVFAHISHAFLEFVRGAELLIHNAPFDVGFINSELAKLGLGRIEEICTITDTLGMAKRLYPGQRNGLDALCKRLGVDNSARTAHGALLDATLLAEVYFEMTRGQNKLDFSVVESRTDLATSSGAPMAPILRVLVGSDDLAAHAERLRALEKSSKGNCMWLKLDS
jgi:DNA polymerase III subunit epsilon